MKEFICRNRVYPFWRGDSLVARRGYRLVEKEINFIIKWNLLNIFFFTNINIVICNYKLLWVHTVVELLKLWIGWVPSMSLNHDSNRSRWSSHTLFWTFVSSGSVQYFSEKTNLCLKLDHSNQTSLLSKNYPLITSSRVLSEKNWFG